MKQDNSQQLTKLGKKISIVNIIFYIALVPLAILNLFSALLKLPDTSRIILSTIVILLDIAELVLLCLLNHYQHQLRHHLDDDTDKDTKK